MDRFPKRMPYVILATLALVFALVFSIRPETTVAANIDALAAFRSYVQFHQGADLEKSDPQLCQSFARMYLTVRKTADSGQNVLDLVDFVQASCDSRDRNLLFLAFVADDLWEAKAYSKACDMLLAVGAGHHLLEFAARAEEVQDFSGLAEYLACGEKMSQQGVWISPWIMARLYFSLGQNYETHGAIDESIDAYEKSAAWHPTVWHKPFIAGANALVQLGQEDEAIVWLHEGAIRAADPTARFYLWRMLGELWQESADRDAAVCAFRNASRALSDVPETNVSEYARSEFERFFATLLEQADLLKFSDSCDRDSD